MGPLPRGPREEAVQGAAVVGPFQAQGAAESDASVRLGVRSHVPGTRRNRAQAEEAGIRKAKPPIETPSVGMGPQTPGCAAALGGWSRVWEGLGVPNASFSVGGPLLPAKQSRWGPEPNPLRGRLPKGFAQEPPPENVASARAVARPQARRAAVRPLLRVGVGMLDWRRARRLRLRP